MLLQAAPRSWSTFLVAVVLWMFAGCSAGGDSALSSAENPVGDSAGTGSFPQPDDAVFALVADGSGGVYVGGQFTRLGQLTRQRLARGGRIWPPWIVWPVLRRAGSCRPTTQSCRSSTMGGGCGGLFATIGGERRSRLAAVDKATGLLTRWSPDANALVRTIVVSGGRVFVGGDFTTVNGVSRRALAVLSAETGEIIGE
jgi:trimeric autotransporter adhesin